MKNKGAFTLVELIVVITILAVLGTIAFIAMQSYTLYARDSVRLSNMRNIESGLKIQYTKGGSYAVPDDSVSITASGTTIRKQGVFGKNALRTIKANTDASKDPLTEEYYDYITDSNLSEYQLIGYMEGDTASNVGTTGLLSLQESYASTGTTIKSLGQDLGLVLKDNVALHKTPTNVGNSFDIRNNSNQEYTIKFDQGDEITSNSGAELFSNVYNRSKALLKNKSLAKLDDGLVGYWDMETTYLSGTTIMLKDLSKYGHHGYCYNGASSLVNCGESVGPQFIKNDGAVGSSMYFDGINDYINVGDHKLLDIGNTSKTFFVKFKLPDYIPEGWDSHLFGKLKLGGSREGYFIGIRGLTDPNVTRHGKLIYYLGNGELTGNNKQLHYYSINNINDNSYNHVGITVDRNENKMFILMNGEEIENDISNFDSGEYTNQPFYIGKSAEESFDGGIHHKFIKGMISEIRTYNRLLSKKEFNNIYGSTLK